jgi:hypothetical protein
MKRNVGTIDRLARVLASAALLSCSVMAPLPLVTRMAIFGVAGAYLLFTALTGSCLGYRLMGKSTCPGGSRQ